MSGRTESEKIPPRRALSEALVRRWQISCTLLYKYRKRRTCVKKTTALTLALEFTVYRQFTAYISHGCYQDAWLTHEGLARVLRGFGLG